MAPSILTTAALGSTVATISVSMNDGSAFTGNLGFVWPNFNNGVQTPPNGGSTGVFALSGSGANWLLIVNSNGPGLGGMTTVDNVSIHQVP